MLRRYLVAPVLLLALAISACGGENLTGSRYLDVESTLDGTWAGKSQGVTVNLTLNEASGGALSGSGTITGSQSLAVTASGTHVHPDVNLTLSATGAQDMNFFGSMSGVNTIDGVLNGSVYQNFAITLTRE